MADPTTVDYERIRQENDRLRAENAALRPMISDLQHRLAIAVHHAPGSRCADCEFNPTSALTNRFHNGG